MRRLKLGFLTVHGDAENHSMMMNGVFKAAEEHNAEVIRFATKVFDEEIGKYNAELNYLYKVIEAQKLDGLMFLGWMPGLVGEFFHDFLRHFNTIPIVSLGTGYENIPNVYADSEKCIQELLEHMIKVHGYKRIVFVPPAISDVRNLLYKEVMEKYGLYNQNYIINYDDLRGITFDDRMKRVLSILIDERKVKFDAILLMYDTDAQNLMKELKLRGINVPNDLAIASYEDTEFSNYSIPPLTTITYPWREVGYQGCEKIIKLINHEPVEHSTPISSKLIIRNSCGCSSNLIKLSKIDSRLPENLFTFKFEYKQISNFIEDINRAFPYTLLKVDKLLYALVNDLEEAKSTAFIMEFEHQLQEILKTYPYIEIIDEIERTIYYIRSLIISNVSMDSRILVLFEDIILKVQVIIKEKAITILGLNQLHIKKADQELHKVSQELINTFTVKELLDVLEKSLVTLGIPSCYVYRFTDYTLDHCRMIFGFENSKRLTIDDSLIMNDLHIADGIVEKHKKLLCELLYVNNDFLGFIVFEPSLTDERIYHTLSMHISSALNGALLLENLTQEITLRKEKEAQLLYIANYDSLTGLFNRRYFYHTVNHIMEWQGRCESNKQQFFLLFIDVDNFKQVNDSAGHDFGDALLKETANRLHKALDRYVYHIPDELLEANKNCRTEAIFRLGGDEFTAIVTGLTAQEMEKLAEETVNTVKAPFHISDQLIMVTCSVGISVYPEDSDRMEMIIKYADRAMYHAKGRKDSYCFYNAEEMK